MLNNALKQIILGVKVKLKKLKGTFKHKENDRKQTLMTA